MNRYVVRKKSEEKIDTNSCMAEIDLSNNHAIIACGYDPYDPFVDYEICKEYIDSEEAARYGLKTSDVIYDDSMIDNIYEQRFDTKINREATA